MTIKEEKTARNKERMIDALKKTWGIVTVACEMAQVSRITHYHWLKMDPDYKIKIEDINEAQIDFVESKLLDNIDQGKEQSIKFYLACKGRSRGYKSPNNIADEETPLIPTEQTIIILPHNDRDEQKFLESGEKE